MNLRHLTAACLVPLALASCATTDPAESFRSTRDLVAGRHPGKVAWPRDEAARAAADGRVRELLAAPLGPDAAAEVALLRSPALQATLERLGVAQADLAQATRLANPGLAFARLSGSGETQRTGSLTADLVDWLVQPLRRRIAEAELEHVKLEVGHALLAAVAEARLALVDYQAAAELVERLARVEEIDAAAAEYARALHAAGNLTALERAHVEADWGETRAERRRARVVVAERREAVVLALGLGGAEAWTASPLAPLPAEAGEAGRLEETAVAGRLDLAAGRWAVSALERALSLKRKTRLLPVGVEVGVEREREREGVTLTGPVVELRLPLFDTGKASVARLEAELARARWQLAALEGAVRSEVRRRSEELAAGRELVALYRDDVLPLRREVFDRSLREYNQMLVGAFELLLAKQAEVTAERRAVEALAGYWRARFALERAVGGPLPTTPAPQHLPEAEAAEPGVEPEAEPAAPHDHHGHHGAAAADGRGEDR